METLESALALLLDHAQSVTETETVPLLSADGRRMAEDVISPLAVPPFDRSPLDGYCLHSADIAQASRENPAVLRVIGEACAGCGDVFAPGPGEALRVMTGAPVPPCCDCVIRQEDTDEGMDQVRIYAPVKAGGNICRAGEDVARGALVLRSGDVLDPVAIGVLSSLGITEVKVFRQVKVALLCTGDELCAPGQPLPFGKIYDSNRAVLTARLRRLGVAVQVLSDVPDNPEEAAERLRQAAESADILLTTGGVSVGKKDIMHQVLPLLGAQRLLWRIAMKPGSPLLCGLLGQKLLICLSGNPFAALCCFEVFAKPVLAKLGGARDVGIRRLRVPLADGFGKASPGRRLIRARYDGQAVHVDSANHSSGSLMTMLGCNCFVDIPAGSGPLEAGQNVEILLL